MAVELTSAKKEEETIRPEGYVPIASLPLRVPDRISKLTQEWLTDALRLKGKLKPEGKVTSMEVKPIGEGLGMMADMALIHLELEGATDGAPTRMVAKFAPHKAKMPSFMVKFQLRNEAHFYNDFSVKAGGLSRPECYLAAERKRSKPTFIMLLEMVDNATAYTRIGGCDHAEHLHQAVAALGGLHSRWWGHKKRTAPLAWAMHPHAGLGRIFFSRTWFAYSLRKAVPAMKLWDPELFAPLIGMADLLKRGIAPMIKQCTSPPFTLVHGDAHLDNIFFAERFDGGCAFIDHANMMLMKPLLDVAFFLGTNLHPDVRRAHEDSLLRHYHAALLAGGVDGVRYPFETCWRDYRWAMLQCFFGYGCFVVQDYAKQKRTRTGVYAADEGTVSKGDRNLLKVYQGDSPSNPGFNGRLVAAIVDLKCDELIRDALGLTPTPKLVSPPSTPTSPAKAAAAEAPPVEEAPPVAAAPQL